VQRFCVGLPEQKGVKKQRAIKRRRTMDRFAVQEGCLNMQWKPRQFCAMRALTLAGAVLLFPLPSAGAQTQPAT